MPERDDLEPRVAAAVRRLAARAATSVDPVAVTWRAADAGGRSRWTRWWLGAGRALAWAVLLGLLLGLLAAGSLLLSGGGRPTLAPLRPTAVTATESCWRDGQGDGAVAAALADPEVRCVLVSSDPHVDGASTYVFRGAYPSAAPGDPESPHVAWGDYHLDGTEATWAGRFHAVGDASGRLRIVGFAEGTGAYDGWTYAFAVGTGADPTDVAGAVYPGAPPPGYPPD
jgi:hypothetical protein